MGGKERAFDALTQRTVTQIHQREPGTLLYLCHTVTDAPSERIFYELYRDRAAFAAHEAQPYVQRFLTEREPLLEQMDVHFLTPTLRAGIALPEND